jgi:hypothetical protein
MKDLFRYIFYLIACLIFAFGMFVLAPTEPIETATAQVLIPAKGNSNAAPPRPSVVNDFVPEFVGLPNFGEADNDVALETKRARLVAISEFKSSDEPWPSYSKNDLNITSGETWLGLFASKREMHLATTKVTRSRREGYIGPGDQLHDWLKYERKGNLIFLVKDVPELKPGRVTTLYKQQMLADPRDSELSDGYRREFVLGKDTYILRTSRGITKDGTKAAVLVLERNGISQVIDKNFHSPAEDRDIIGSLIWAGDLDGDGKLDLYIDRWNEKGSVVTILQLSTFASDGELIGDTATFSSSGC